MKKYNLKCYLFVIASFFLVSPLFAQNRINAEDFSEVSGGIRSENNPGADEGRDIGYIKNGSFALYKNLSFSGGRQAKFSAASKVAGGTIEVRLDSPSGRLLGTAKITSTQSWSTFETLTVNISPISGTHDLYLVFRGGSGYLMNLDWFEISGVGISSATKNTNTLPASTPTTSKALPVDIAGSWYGSKNKRGRLNFWQNGDEFEVIASWPDDKRGVWYTGKGKGTINKDRTLSYRLTYSTTDGTSKPSNYVVFLKVREDNKSLIGYYEKNGVRVKADNQHYFRTK